MDAVNEFFHRHYPADAKTAWQLRPCGGGYGREYTGDRLSRSHIFPEIVCRDGFRFSVQGHFGAYSCPRDDFADEYTEAELCLKVSEPMLEERGCRGRTYDDITIYGYVPVNLVCAIIDKHGGILS